MHVLGNSMDQLLNFHTFKSLLAMPTDDDDAPNDFLNSDDEDPEETQREHEARRKRIDNLPLMKKA